MKKKASDANKEIAKKGDNEYGIMTMFDAAHNSLIGKKYKHEICQSIDNLSGIYGSIVILAYISVGNAYEGRTSANFFTPVYC